MYSNLKIQFLEKSSVFLIHHNGNMNSLQASQLPPL
jgi:hypothetical protein